MFGEPVLLLLLLLFFTWLLFGRQLGFQPVNKVGVQIFTNLEEGLGTQETSPSGVGATPTQVVGSKVPNYIKPVQDADNQALFENLSGAYDH